MLPLSLIRSYITITHIVISVPFSFSPRETRERTGTAGRGRYRYSWSVIYTMRPRDPGTGRTGTDFSSQTFPWSHKGLPCRRLSQTQERAYVCSIRTMYCRFAGQSGQDISVHQINLLAIHAHTPGALSAQQHNYDVHRNTARTLAHAQTILYTSN